MERVVKFRGRNYDGTWMYGYLMPTPKPQIHPNNKYSISVSPQALTSVDKVLYEVETDTIGQFTGLHDYKGREIYEGDVICSELVSGREVLHKIEYNVENAMFVAKPLEGLDFDYCHIYKHWIWRYGKEVIGNIYDTPNFLTDDND